MIGIDWRFNAWGGKYHPHDSDAAAAKAVCAAAGVRCESSPLGLEGGAIETDGQGRLLTTPDCVITDSRNPGWTREQISEEFFRTAVSARRAAPAEPALPFAQGGLPSWGYPVARASSTAPPPRDPG